MPALRKACNDVVTGEGLCSSEAMDDAAVGNTSVGIVNCLRHSVAALPMDCHVEVLKLYSVFHADPTLDLDLSRSCEADVNRFCGQKR